MDKVELDRIRELYNSITTIGCCGVINQNDVAKCANYVPALLAEVDRLNDAIIDYHRVLFDERAECIRRVCQLKEQKKNWVDANIELQGRVCALEHANKSLKNELDFSVAAEQFNAGELERVRNTRDSAIDRMDKLKDERDAARRERDSAIEELKLKKWGDRVSDGAFAQMKMERDLAVASRNDLRTKTAARRTITDLVAEAYQNAVEHGFWDKEPNFGELIALCHSELSEALEAHRAGRAVDDTRDECDVDDCVSCGPCVYCKHNKPEGVPTELADCVIRIFDLCGHYGIDLEAVIARKMAYNKTRERLHGKGY